MRKNLLVIWLAIITIFFAGNVLAQRQMENLDRGIVAVKVGVGVFVSWRIFGDERTDVSYNLYRDGVKINDMPITGASNYSDNTGAMGNTYQVAAIIKGAEHTKSVAVGVQSQNYFDIPLQIPAGGVTPANETYTYSPSDCSVGDLDSDGKYEIVVKWEPSNAKDNSQGGYTGPVIMDAYKLDGTRLWSINLGINIRAGAHYTQFMVYDLDGDGKAEVAFKTAPGTKDGLGNFLNTGPAGTDNDAADYRDGSGHITTGPEYLSLFNGQTGAEMVTINYLPGRDPANGWGRDDDYTNRVNRHLACIAYLDGSRPSLIMCRGYYGRAVLVAYDWRNGTLTHRWTFDSNAGYSNYGGQGNHNLSVADVDNDGKDEIIYGACTIDDNGTGKYSTWLGHGDALHVSDMDPDRPGLEVWQPHEGGSGATFRDANTGSVIWKFASLGDVGRGMADDIDATRRGAECWAAGSPFYSSKGQVISSSVPNSNNFRIYWDGDGLSELLDGTTISKYNVGSLLSGSGCYSNNGSKSTPGLSADIFGDWREEVIWRTSDNANLRVFTTTTPTNLRMYTLMHNKQYRLAIAWQNVAYNQPPHLDFLIGDELNACPPVPITGTNKVWKGDAANNIWDIASQNWLKNNATAAYTDDDSVLFDFKGISNVPVTLNSELQPSTVTVFSTTNYTFSGTGKLSGNMMLIKSGSGSLTLNNENTYTGRTEVWDGSLIINDTLENSSVVVRGGVFGGVKAEGKEGGRLAGKGYIKNSVTLLNKGCITPGDALGSVDSITIGVALIEKGTALNRFDLSDDPSGITKPNDNIIVKGDISFSDSVYFIINKVNGALTAGDYVLFRYTGTFTGNLNKITVIGIPGIKYTIENKNNSIVLNIAAMRAPSSIVWTGDVNNVWDLATTSNWLKGETPEIFVTGDTVNFLDNFSGNNNINISGIAPSPGRIVIESSTDYTFGGTTGLIGSGGLIKNGTGKLAIPTTHSFTGAVNFTGGTLELALLANAGVASSLGAGGSAASNVVFNDIAVKFTGANSSTDRGMTLAGDTISVEVLTGKTVTISGILAGTGKLQKTGTGTLYLNGVNTYSGGSIIKSGTVQLGEYSGSITPFGQGYANVVLENATISMAGSGNDNGSYNQSYWNINVPQGFTGTLRADGRCDFYGSLTGNGTLNLFVPWIRTVFRGNWSAFNGRINLNTDGDGGDCRLANSNGYAGTSFNLSSGVTMFYEEGSSGNPGTSQTVNIGELSGVSGSFLINENWIIGAKNTSSTYNGIISGNSLTKAGTGSLTLSGANTYAGGTTINGGTLILTNSTGSGTGTGTVAVNNLGILAGYGIMSSAVNVNSGGTLAPGNTFGTLTINNTITMQPGSKMLVRVVSGTGSSSKIASGTNKFSLNGTLEIENISGTYTNGNSFTIINGSNIVGGFTSITPATPGEGLVWDTTMLRSNGIIKVLTDPLNSLPVIVGNLPVSLFPNPTIDGNISIESGNTLKILKAEVYNSVGLKLLEKEAKNTRLMQIDLGTLPSEVYFIHIIADGKVVVKKVVKR